MTSILKVLGVFDLKQEELDKVLQEEQSNRNNNDFATETSKSSQALVKFGWIKGVLVRNNHRYLISCVNSSLLW